METRRYAIHAFPTGDIIEIQPSNREILPDTVAEIILLKTAQSLKLPANLIKLVIKQTFISMPLKKDKSPTFLENLEPNEENLIINVVKIPWWPLAQNISNTMCPVCAMVLNGPEQLEDHCKGNKHQKHLMRYTRRI